MFRRNTNKGNYAYAVARVKAKKSLLLGEEDYNKMLMMTAPEISRYISEAGYSKEMTELASKYEGIELLEHATYANMANVFHSLLGASQGELKDTLSAYLEKWDIWNVKIILRGKSFGLDADSIRDSLVPAGSLSAESLDKLLAMDSKEEIIPAFGKMAGVPQQDIQNALAADGNQLGGIEDYLDKYHIYKMLASIDPSTRPGRMFQDYARMVVDAKNLETILKLKAEGIYGEKVMDYFIPGGREIDRKLATQLANSETIAAFANDASQTEFADFIKQIADNDNVLVRDVVREMQKYEIAQAKKFAHMYPLSIVPIIDYMIHKELEVMNVRTIARGLESGLDKELIKGLLVI